MAQTIMFFHFNSKSYWRCFCYYLDSTCHLNLINYFAIHYLYVKVITIVIIFFKLGILFFHIIANQDH